MTRLTLLPGVPGNPRVPGSPFSPCIIKKVKLSLTLHPPLCLSLSPSLSSPSSSFSSHSLSFSPSLSPSFVLLFTINHLQLVLQVLVVQVLHQFLVFPTFLLDQGLRDLQGHQVDLLFHSNQACPVAVKEKQNNAGVNNIL